MSTSAPPGGSARPPVDTPAGLATMLAEALAEIDVLRNERAALQKRAESAERLSSDLQVLHNTSTRDPSSSSKSDETALLVAYHTRAAQAERAREEADARVSFLVDSWNQLSRYLKELDTASAEACVAFTRALDGASLVLAPVPVMSDNGRSRRPRNIAVEEHAQTSGKRTRSEYEQVPHTARKRTMEEDPEPPNPPTSTHAKRSSSSSSLSVDEMLLQTTDDGPITSATSNTQDTPPIQIQSYTYNPPLFTHNPRQLPYHQPSSQPQSTHGGPVRRAHTASPLHSRSRTTVNAASNTPQQVQTHIFAPVVTGPPVKRGRYAQSQSLNNLASSASPANTSSTPGPASGPGGAPFPATNAAGQRTCRACGVAGRYKDGKCIEKWGPGPAGPGTVCDRCRKKMKRVERRATLDAQAAPPLLVGASSSRSLTQRTDTMLAHAAPAGSNSRIDLQNPSPGPVIAVLPSEEEGEGEESRVEAQDGNGDADAEAEAGAQELQYPPDREGEAEEDILAAVEATEADGADEDSNAGWMKHEGG
ncbi:hypothetical protein H0H81_011300 [Sphagnurus paluster]|uniref:Uncharacterized protein n=1 Tax=Sphagnurus paluster TaxID=117069 RepID=A0A9P7K529_9AGAR|nr:hypothetical protein H0H81_011300 [Sphagnurus paluster]